MIIRKATLDDTEALRALYDGSLAHMAYLQPRQFRPCQQELSFVQKGILEENAEIFVAEIDGIVAGMAAVFLEEIEPKPYRFGYWYADLDTLYISEYYRGRGIGKKLFQTVKRWAKEHGAENIQLMTLGENALARQFYESLGLKESKIQYILEDI